MKQFDTGVFRTKTIMVEKKNPCIDGTWEIGLDIGYGGVKYFAPNKYGCFPAYAVRSNGQRIATGNDSSELCYMSADRKEIWLVGQYAQDGIAPNEITISKETMYGRNRFSNPMFKAIALTGLGLAMLSNSQGNPDGKEIYLQTGLPPKYLNDKEGLKNVLVGEHHFFLRIGSTEYELHFSIQSERIYFISQPMGACLSVSIDENGRNREDKKSGFKGAKLLRNFSLVVDGGFGTFDTFDIRKGYINNETCETFKQFGMEAVLELVIKEIQKNFHVEVSFEGIQKILSDGFVKEKKFDEEKGRKIFVKHDIGEIVQKCSKEICRAALNQIDTTYNDLEDYQYLVVSGGTGAAWLKDIREHYEGNEDLTILSSVEWTNLQNTFGNVRGYYMFLYQNLKNNKI